MRYVFLLLVFSLASCSPKEEHDMAAHSAESMILDSDQPAASGMSLYQVESTWLNQSGTSLSLSDLAGRVQVVAMTYTSCQMSCPRIVSAMKDIQKAVDQPLGFTLISIDPERDSVATLAAYASKMNLDLEYWNLLTGEADDVREMAALLGVRFRKMPDGEFAHSNLITVLDAQGVIQHQQNGIATDLTQRTIDFLQK